MREKKVLNVQQFCAGFVSLDLKINPSPVMSKKLSQTEQEFHDQIYELEKKIKSLEAELKRSNMARDAYDCMIDLAEKTYNIL